MLDNILKNMNLFFDGVSYAGNVEEVTLPKITIKTESYRNGGMDSDIDIDMGIEKLEASFTLTKFDPAVLKSVGLVKGKEVPLAFRGALESDSGTVKGVIAEMRGTLRDADPGSWKPGDRASIAGAMTCKYYKLTVEGEVIYEIDVANYKRVIGGVDQLAAHRAALGL